ncbi:HAD-like domain-containing protein [Chaetomium fimeti]|uniref:HAD-like domain-containing protein n=1 Tax=Chaetomium fimeti TaxID=1854472 RepID=A0AAE0LNM0_9PEZI|nr:HAD-like domain-containing protein [Chaetomium fimeti]
MTPRTDFPPVRACLFDMDGLLLDTEDLYTLCVNLILEKYQRPNLPWSVKAKLQGRPGPAANQLFHEWAQLPITQEEYIKQLYALQAQHFPTTQPLPGVPELLAHLGRTRYWDLPSQKKTDNTTTTNTNPSTPTPQRVHIALATSSHAANFRLKTAHLSELFSVFPTARRVLGDDARIGRGRGKPLPDIFLLALQTINDSLPAGERAIAPEECLVFEDSVPGVEAGRRAGMRVVWCPHPMLKKEVAGREGEVLAGRTGEAGDVDLHQVGEVGDGWAEYMPTLLGFPYEKYGIVVPPAEVEAKEGMVEGGKVADGEVVQVVETA